MDGLCEDEVVGIFGRVGRDDELANIGTVAVPLVYVLIAADGQELDGRRQFLCPSIKSRGLCSHFHNHPGLVCQ